MGMSFKSRVKLNGLIFVGGRLSWERVKVKRGMGRSGSSTSLLSSFPSFLCTSESSSPRIRAKYQCQIFQDASLNFLHQVNYNFLCTPRVLLATFCLD